MPKIYAYFSGKINWFFLLTASLFLTINSLFYISSQGAFLPIFHTSISSSLFFLIYFFIPVGTLFFLHPASANTPRVTLFSRSLLFLFFPTIIVFLYVLQNNFQCTPYVGIFSACYVIFFNIFLIKSRLEKEVATKIETPEKSFFSNTLSLTLLLTVMLASFSFGFFHLGKMAVVDEPLWTFDRIPNFWRDFGEMDWRNANVSDKPGQTVAVLSGIGLLAWENPKEMESIPKDFLEKKSYTEKMEIFNRDFRLPIWIFVILMAPVIFFFVRRLFGNNVALFSIIFIYLSPIMIGNSRIINPDSLLWLFTTLSLLSFLIYLKENLLKFLFWSAFFLGLGILTKYTANILYFFFLGLLLLQSTFRIAENQKNPFHFHLKRYLLDYVYLVIVSFSTFFVLYPAAWGKPVRLINSTLFSQAVEPLWVPFLLFLFFLFIDTFFWKNYFLKKIFLFLTEKKLWLFRIFLGIFIFSLLSALLNVYSEMLFFDFQDILASPKSSFSNSSLIAFFLANFYPLIFGINPIALVSFLIFSFILLKKVNFENNNHLNFLFLMLFPLIYYCGTTASQVAATIRYQIIVFPIFLIAAAIAWQEILRLTRKSKIAHSFLQDSLLAIGLMIFSGISLWQIAPHYMGYASWLLPKKYYLDVKDMGEGSYEAALYLNSLPEPKNISIWTDKQGVCVFFLGKCHTKISTDFFANTHFDYLVLSSGRKSRTTKIRGDLFIQGVPLKEIYETKKYQYLLTIAGRENNQLKIVGTDSLEK